MVTTLDFQVNSRHGQNKTYFKNYPTECPVCLKSINIQPLDAYSNHGDCRSSDDTRIEMVLQCPDTRCRAFFIYQFRSHINNVTTATFSRMLPKSFTPIVFDQEINDISPKFLEIYNQAGHAESLNLTDIVGPGYRKALEHLIRDYLILKANGNQAEIDNIKAIKNLQKLISEKVDDVRVKTMAERAWWLGNDESHYEKEWLDCDLDTLKKLIKLTTHWIGSEYLTEQLNSTMPKPTKKAVANN